jgi:hypothetical protein
VTPEEERLLAAFEPRRAIFVTRGEAAELGSDPLLDWDTCTDEPWVVNVNDLAAWRRDANRWRSTRKAVVNIGAGLFFGAVFVGFLLVLSVVLGRLS